MLADPAQTADCIQVPWLPGEHFTEGVGCLAGLVEAFAAKPRQLEPEARLPVPSFTRIGLTAVLFAGMASGCRTGQVLAQTPLELDVVSLRAEQA